MNKLYGSACIAVVLALVLGVWPVHAIDTPTLTFIPSKLSVNSSFMVIADPHASATENVRVLWIVGGEEGGYGLFPKIGDKWICYFSDTDPLATCGPALFREKGSYSFIVRAKNQYGEITDESAGENNVTIGGISLQTDVNIQGNNVTVVVYPSTLVDGVSYTVYDSNGEPVQGKSGSLQKKVYSYVGSITLPDGVYYIAFEAESSSTNDFGGGLIKVTTGVGQSSGNYRLVSDPVVWSTVIEAGGTRQKSNFRITNTGTSPAKHITVSIPSELSDYIAVSLPKTELNSSESMYFTFTLKNIEHGMEIKTKLDVLSDGFKVGEIPVNVLVSVINESGGTYSCEGKTDGSDCMGGICCGGICRKRATCCSSSDCDNGEECQNYVCKAASSSQQNVCEGETDGTVCTQEGSTGICCNENCIVGGECCNDFDCSEGNCIGHKCETSSAGECEGKEDGDFCSNGYCYREECVECFKDSQCYNGTCDLATNTCTASTGGGGGIDITIILIIALVVVGGIGAYIYLKDMKKKKEGEESEYKEEDFDEEEFY